MRTVSAETLECPVAVVNVGARTAALLSTIACGEFVHPAHYTCVSEAFGRPFLDGWRTVAPYEVGNRISGHRFVVWVDDLVSESRRAATPAFRFIVDGTSGPYFVGTGYLAVYAVRSSNSKTFERLVSGGAVHSVLALPQASSVFEMAQSSGALRLEWKDAGAFENTTRCGPGATVRAHS